MPSTKAPLDLTHGGEYGNHGLPVNAVSSFGWQLMTSARRWTGWLDETCRTQSSTPFVVFAREFWYLLLRRVGLVACSPQPSETIFQD
jgi:hypothetical protein